jgi:HEAT repeat protein
MNTTRIFSLHLALIVLMPVLRFVEVQRPASEQQPDALPKELLSRLASGNEEDRLDAVGRFGALWRKAPEPVESTIIAALGNTLQQDPSPLVRAMAAKALEGDSDNSENEKAVSPLIAALAKERAPAVRKAIIYALAGYTQPQVISALTPFLDNKNLELRAAASYAVAETGNPTSEKPLTNVLKRRGKEEDGFARSQAARGLGIIGSRDSIDPLMEALATDRSEEVRREAALALGRIATLRDTKVVEALRSAALSNDPYLVLAADNALASIKKRKP